MALKISTEVGKTGLFLDYLKIECIHFEQERSDKVQVTVGIYANAEASHDGLAAVNVATIDLDYSDFSEGSTILEMAYGALKKQATFSEAIDC